MSSVKNYLSLIKFSHSIFALPFAIIGFFLGLIEVTQYNIDFSLPGSFLRATSGLKSGNSGVLILLLLVLGCMVSARSAAMAFNRYLDRSIDILNPRTAVREIPAGVISEKNALIFTILSCLVFLTCTFFINWLCFLLSPVALFVILFYSYTKRFTPLCHLVLGVGLALAPIGAYIAVTGSFAVLPILFSVAVLFWVSGFDIIYALQDEGFDRDNKLFSIPAWLGKERALTVSSGLHLISALCICAAGLYGGFGVWYWLGAALFVGMLIYQHTLVKPNDLSRVNLAFMTANGIASIIFSVMVLLDMFL